MRKLNCKALPERFRDFFIIFFFYNFTQQPSSWKNFPHSADSEKLRWRALCWRVYNRHKLLLWATAHHAHTPTCLFTFYKVGKGMVKVIKSQRKKIPLHVLLVLSQQQHIVRYRICQFFFPPFLVDETSLFFFSSSSSYELLSIAVSRTNCKTTTKTM